ncbi:hypothetical protein NDU88_010410 [Pleurodeles waltl]|uniref:Uncharacterized protein n=1 Tax=Pleurodeles waltl TaxID=8319 RepID=A0AAV7Q234_PLEWA|nr:hypothetical protein NDU88_010410 [Pleurodeles waltl]
MGAYRLFSSPLTPFSPGTRRLYHAAIVAPCLSFRHLVGSRGLSRTCRHVTDCRRRLRRFPGCDKLLRLRPCEPHVPAASHPTQASIALLHCCVSRGSRQTSLSTQL